MAAALGMDAVGFAEGGVVFALRGAVHPAIVRLRLRFPPHERRAPDVDAAARRRAYPYCSTFFPGKKHRGGQFAGNK